MVWSCFRNGGVPEGMFGLKDRFGHEVAGVIILEPVEHARAFLP
jgi:hypothetical protein